LLLQEFGPEWAKEHLVPQVLAMIKNPHYLYRMTVLVAISSLANFVSPDVFVSTMLPVLVSCAKDRVPNVKFNVAKVCACAGRCGSGQRACGKGWSYVL
jgi:serine/threonine-protein phosphatase 2A regulatory subunit A